MDGKNPTPDETRQKVLHALDQLPAQIQSARKRRGRTQEQIAVKAGLSAVTLSKIEIRKNVPSLETLLALAHALEVSPNELLGWTASDGVPSQRQLSNDRLLVVTERLSDDWIELLIELAAKATKR